MVCVPLESVKAVDALFTVNSSLVLAMLVSGVLGSVMVAELGS